VFHRYSGNAQERICAIHQFKRTIAYAELSFSFSGCRKTSTIFDLQSSSSFLRIHGQNVLSQIAYTDILQSTRMKAKYGKPNTIINL
jgi:hypothetical protein